MKWFPNSFHYIIIHEAACADFLVDMQPLVLSRQCADLQSQEPRTKLWLFDTLVTPTLLYGVETWGPSLNKANHWKDLEIKKERKIY